jgi:hypothetical protein
MRCCNKAMFRIAITGALAMSSLAMGLVTQASAGCVNPPGFKAGAFQPISWQGTGEFGRGSPLLVADREESVDGIVGLWKVRICCLTARASDSSSGIRTEQRSITPTPRQRLAIFV